MGLLGTPKYPPLSARLAGGVTPPPKKTGAATTRAPDTPLDAVALQPPPTGCWWVGGAPCGGMRRPGDPKPVFQTHLHTLRKLTNQSPRADTQSKINAAS
jgi:hypothetical protein